MKLTKYIPYALLAVAIVVILHLLEMKRNQRMSLESVINQKTNEFKIRLTADSLRIAHQERAYLTKSNEVSKYYAKEMEAIKRELGGKIDKVNSMVRATFLVTTQGKVKTIVDTTISISDSVGSFHGSATFSDKHFKIGVSMNKDTTIFNPIQYSATFTAAGFTKKKWIFGKETSYINAWLDDKNANITGLTNFEVKEFKDKRFGIGPFVGYDIINNRPSAGVAVSYDLFKF